ncbi:MAG: hypothetical protein EP343_23400 [Deltaproteobacteria bacterium]|nr:MAG: hypothetical protein EP343_23400 [Deltaproteobacteria bacterium]
MRLLERIVASFNVSVVVGLSLLTLATFHQGCSGKSSCFVDAECPEGQHCKANVCFQECTDDDSCPLDHKCNVQAGRCEISVCTPQASKACVGDNIYWLNSCGTRGALVEDCGGRGCKGVSCNSSTQAQCGNNNCEFGENCVSCPKDCPCAPGICDVATATCKEKPNPCGNGTCEANEGENCATCSNDCTCSATQVCDPASQACITKPNSCPNGTCDTAKGENCSTCVQDCPCPSKQVCQRGSCVEPTPCGNGSCEAAQGENCSSCPKDCPCQNGLLCINGKCQATTGCNNDGFCQTNRGENCANCNGDCGCAANQQCINEACKAVNFCGNGTCESSKGENCGTCSKDCTCPGNQSCQNNACRSTCGNGFCEPSKGEDCGTCSKDCTCLSGQQCKNGSCQATCGNGTCEASKGETCSTCTKDCSCSSNQVCKSGTCQQDGCSGLSSLWKCTTQRDKRQRCGVITGYKLQEENCPNGCKTNTINDACCACKVGSKRCVGNELQVCQSDCNTWKASKTCDPDKGQYCSTLSGDCKCTNLNACPKLYGYRCKGTERQWCWKDSTTQCQFWIKSSLQCKDSTPVCNEGNCCACVPGTKRCNVDKIEICNSDCKSWSTHQKCTGGFFCCGLKCSCI